MRQTDTLVSAPTKGQTKGAVKLPFKLQMRNRKLTRDRGAGGERFLEISKNLDRGSRVPSPNRKYLPPLMRR
jgi:hypothetical protein